ncbi:MAG: mandelate racemase/muconate lactonizing enzyme family protein [Lautropia sp.]
MRPARVEAFVFRAPIEAPVQTSFGLMTDRPMVLVRVTDEDGRHGWGEAWCNFPQVGAEHRARLVEALLAPIACARAYDDPQALFRHLAASVEVLALQSGEPGPFAQAIAAIDTAAWDLVARRAGLPLWRLLGARSARIRVYASGLNPTAPERLALERRAAGHRAFKLKIGFGQPRDLANLDALRAALGAQATLMVDANQAYDLPEAIRMLKLLEPYDLEWLEEPLRADRPWSEWLQLHSHGPIPLAGGENVAGDAAFDDALGAGAFDVVQPDLAKWGGISGCAPLVSRIESAGRRYCPHFLGGGIGLLASAHLLTLGGGDGLLEIDSNPNPLRSELEGPLASITDGEVDLGEAPGLGVDVDLDVLARYRVDHRYGR